MNVRGSATLRATVVIIASTFLQCSACQEVPDRELSIGALLYG